MKKYYYGLLLPLLVTTAAAQAPGDTLVVSTLNYGSTTRDTFVQFPDLPPGVAFEKIYMLYNMRCKNGLVSPPQQGQTNIGCGEWDYICNTYVVDSVKKDSTQALHPSHIISGFNGTVYNYRTAPTYTYYRYNQQSVNYTTTISETTATVGAGSIASTAPFRAQHRSSKSQFLWTAAELAAAGLTAGNISGLRLNVSNAGTAAQHLRIRMKTTSQTALNAATPELNGFTEVYFLNTTFVNGTNSFNFYNNFTWNGTDNILVEFSFTNPATGNNTTVTSDNTPTITGLVSAGDDYSYLFTGSNMMQLGNGNFSTFSNQISIGFWCYGDPGMLPAPTSIAYATNPAGHRQVNIHLPWENQRVYWDCGSGGPYDRIEKDALPADFEGQWNYWVFTKNTVTGSMKAYLNGSLWHSGTGFTLPVVITDFLLGSGANNGSPYYGKVDEFSLWNTELPAADIQAWMNKSLTAAHPLYSNLLAYYKFDEGVSGPITDASPAAATATVTGSGTPLWRLHAGKDIFKNLVTTTNRPRVTFVKGTYTQTTTAVTVTDSIINTPNTVNSYAVVNGAITPSGTNNYYQAGYSYVYDGTSNNLIDSVNNAATGTVTITQLEYYQKSPSAFQLVSFVTPYGINLDMGMQGKTWVFDVSDFGPVLKGWKRLFMDGGGQYQEQMDIRFMFIVGTPPRDVHNIDNIWKVEGAEYTALLNNSKMEPRQLTLDPGSAAFKVKTAITGHGQEGEFIPRTHFINIDGGSNEFSWQVWKECALNPLYPQGGTWIYDRAGWCPGMATDIQESVLSNAPGSTIQIDYGLNTASGSSNYVISNQLVSYGSPNFTLDAAITDVKNPSRRIEYARTNPMCNQPVIVIRNTGSTPLTSATIEYWVNNNATKESFNWTGNLGFLEQADVTLPKGNLWSAVTGNNDVFHAEIKTPNAGTDAYTFNNKIHSPFGTGEVLASRFIVWVRTNSAASETSYRILDEQGNAVLTRNNLANNTEYRDTMPLPQGCYKFVLSDVDNDGISFWANNDGNGFARLRKADGTALKSFQGDFGKSLEYNFLVDNSLAIAGLEAGKDVKLYPNPATDQFTLEAKDMQRLTVEVYNILGQQQYLPVNKSKTTSVFRTNTLTPGLYHIVVKDDAGAGTVFKLTKL